MKRPRARVLVVGLAFALAGIGCGGGGGGSAPPPAPAISVAPASLDFGTVAPGATADRTFTVANAGGGTLSGAATASAPYAIVGAATYALGPGQGQLITVRLSPASTGAFNGAVACSGGGGASVAVAGGAPVIAVSPGALDFGMVFAGASADLAFTVRNTGGGTLAGTATASVPFSIVGAASYALGAGQDQLIAVRFSPAAAGTFGGAVACSGGAGASVSLAGSAPTIAVDPTALDFGSVALGATADRTFAVRNTGGSTLAGVATTGAPFSVVGVATYDLGPGEEQLIAVRFGPAAAGTFGGAVACSGATGASVAVSGGAPAISVSPAALDFGTVAVGTAADRTFTLRNPGGGTLAGTATAAAPFSIVGTATYALGAGQDRVVTVRFAPAAAGSASGAVACSGGGGASVSLAGAGEAFGLTQRVPVAPLAFPIQQPTPTALTTARAFPNLGFAQPLFLTHPPDGSNRIFVVEKAGRIHVFPNSDAVTTGQRSVFLDIRARVNPEDEEGLRGLAFDPLYASNGRFYVHYSPAGISRRSRISRFFASATDPDRAGAAEEIILDALQPASLSTHKGGMIAFGPDGFLYVALGDGGGSGDPLENGQNLGTLLGKLLRIDVRAGGPGYATPADNPFVGLANARPEIWACGFRNPWRFSFDRQTGTLWLADVGQGAREEVDIVVRGGNYGWDVFEGMLAFEPDGRPFSAFAAPVLDYGRGTGNSVIGGYVYRGTALASLRGAYFYGDFGSGRVFALGRDPVSGAILSNTQVASVGSVVSFGEDEAGEIYAVSIAGGSIHRFRESPGGPPPAPAFPQTLSATGLFASTAALAPAPGLVEYELSSPLWSDGARKRRWIALPGTERIDFDATEAWVFPVGTAIVKHFEIELTVGDPASRRRLETRVLVHEQTGWAGYTYRWNAGQTDADLLPGALPVSETLTIVDAAAPGGQRQQTYDYPSRTDCLRCHTQAAGHILGARTRQLNRDFDYPNGVRDNQLRAFNHIDLFATDIGAPAPYGALPDPAATAAPVAARARSYLDANCSQCHRPGGPTPVDMDLRFDTPAAQAQIVSVRPTAGDLGLADAFRVKPGVKESSVLWERMRRLGAAERMPPLATHVVDPTAVDVIGSWIDAGAP